MHIVADRHEPPERPGKSRSVCAVAQEGVEFYGSIRVNITSGAGEAEGSIPESPVPVQKSTMNPRAKFKRKESGRLSIQPGPTGQAILFRSQSPRFLIASDEVKSCAAVSASLN